MDEKICSFFILIPYFNVPNIPSYQLQPKFSYCFFFFHLFRCQLKLSHPLWHQCWYDTLIPGVPLTTRQPSEYSWMSSNPTPQHRVPFSGTRDLTKIEQSLLCMGSSTQNTTCIITWQHGPILYNDHTESTYE